MNTTANRLTTTVMVAAAIAAFVMIQPAKAAPAVDTNAASAKKASAVVMLPKVTVTGKREHGTSIVYLERVVVTGKRVDNRKEMQAQKDSKPAAAMLVAMR